MLELTDTVSSNPPYFCRFKMMLVAYHRDILEGNNGYAKTTWISSQIDIDNNGSNSFIYWLGENAGWGATSRYYSQTLLREVYNNEEKRPLTSLREQMPFLYKAINSVIKQHVTFNDITDTSVNKLWIPSIYEILGDEGAHSDLDRADWQSNGQELKAPPNKINYSDFYNFSKGLDDLTGRRSFINPISASQADIIVRDNNEDRLKYYRTIDGEKIVGINRQNGLGWYSNRGISSLCFCLG